MGSVLRYDLKGGVETLIEVPEGYGGRLHRATGMAWYQGDLLVASQNDGKVKRYAYPSGEWLNDVALATPGGMTQLAVHHGELYVTDYQAQAIRRTSKFDGSMSEVWAVKDSQHPWGLVFDAQGSAFWSTSANRIVKTVGSETSEWAGAGGGIATPLGLAIGPDGLLYCASWQGAVTVWKTDAVNPGEPLRTIAGKEVKGPISFAFTDREPPDEFVYTLTAALEQTPGKVAFFESQIRPLLHARCMECHDQETQEGGLRLDTPNGWELGGHTGRAIQPGRPDESLLYRAVAYLDKDLKMPPDGQLSAEEMGWIRKWIEQGAIDPRAIDPLLVEQIAGDLLSDPRIDDQIGVVENLIGPMFYHMGEHRHGSSRDFNGVHQEMVNNKIDAFSKAFLATTVACSRCHDHKLEAVSQKDYRKSQGIAIRDPR